MQSPMSSFLPSGKRAANGGEKQELLTPKDVGHGQILSTVGKHVKKTNVERAAAIRSGKKNTQHGKAHLLAALPGARHSNMLSLHRRQKTTHVHQEVE
jgi:hypothetical protein